MPKAPKKKSPTADVPFAVTEWPANRVEMWPLDKIIPYPQNPRTHPPAQISLLASLMKKRGVDQPIVVDEQGVILKGHGRRLAAIEAGFAEFPVAVHRGLSDTEKRAMRIEDNQLALLSGWDEELLRIEIGELQLESYDLPLLGFTPGALKSLINVNSESVLMFDKLFQILIECADENEQLETLKKLEKIGVKCRALIA